MINNSQLGTKTPRIAPLCSGSGPDAEGHLVSTGVYLKDGVHGLFIHDSLPVLADHICHVYSIDVNRQFAVPTPSQPSADFVVKEHGRFRDRAIFDHICRTHPRPATNGQDDFTAWRDSLLAFLDANFSPHLWVPFD
jgi:hypothetical protein